MAIPPSNARISVDADTPPSHRDGDETSETLPGRAAAPPRRRAGGRLSVDDDVADGYRRPGDDGGAAHPPRQRRHVARVQWAEPRFRWTARRHFHHRRCAGGIAAHAGRRDPAASVRADCPPVGGADDRLPFVADRGSRLAHRATLPDRAGRGAVVGRFVPAPVRSGRCVVVRAGIPTATPAARLADWPPRRRHCSRHVRGGAGHAAHRRRLVRVAARVRRAAGRDALGAQWHSGHVAGPGARGAASGGRSTLVLAVNGRLAAHRRRQYCLRRWPARCRTERVGHGLSGLDDRLRRHCRRGGAGRLAEPGGGRGRSFGRLRFAVGRPPDWPHDAHRHGDGDGQSARCGGPVCHPAVTVIAAGNGRGGRRARGAGRWPAAVDRHRDRPAAACGRACHRGSPPDG